MHARRALLAVAIIVSPSMSSALNSRPLALELWINGVCTHHTLLVRREGESFILSRRDLASEGVKLGGNAALVTVDLHGDVRATIDEANQRLMLSAPDKALTPRIFDLRPSALPPTDPMPSGFKLNYDLSAQISDFGAPVSSSSWGFSGAGSYFTSRGTLLASAFAREFSGRNTSARLDTAYVVDDPSHALRWTIGDAISGSLPWAQSVRFAGFQLATDFTLRPDLVTMPLPRFFGQTAVPASIDVLIGTTRVFEADVDPGPFELRNLPIISGGSEATVVMTDVLGRQTTQTISLYNTSDLLAPGLDAHSLEVGFLRRNYGVASFGYDRPMASATFRRGLTPTLTIEAQSELSTNMQLVGAGLAFALEPYAVFDADVAGSFHEGHASSLLSVGFHSHLDRFTISGSWASASNGFADLATLTGAPLDRDRFQVGVSVSLDRLGALSVSEIDRSVDRGAASRLSTASYTLDFGGRFLALSGFYDHCSKRWLASASFDVLLGPRTSATASSNLGAGGAATLTYARDGDPDGGLGYRLSGYVGHDQVTGLDAQGEWYGDHALANLDLSSAGSVTGLRAGVDGALVVVDNHVLATRQSDGAVALVKTGLPDIPVYLEHRAVAVSDSSAEALVPGLVPFAPNHIAINPNDYPIATVVLTDERVATPHRNGAVLVDLSPPARKPLLITVRLESGLFPPIGSPATLDGGQQKFVVGRRGQLFIDDLTAPTTVTITMPDGACRLDVQPAPNSQKHIAKIGPKLCKPVVLGES